MKAKEKSKPQDHNEHKIVISELGISPFQRLRVAFALMGIIPLLVIFYVILGKNFLYSLFIGQSGFVTGLAIIISLVGFLYAYHLVKSMLRQILSYSYERKRSEDEKTDLLISVSHDLKTPLTVVKAGIQNLMDGIGGVLSNMHKGIAEKCLSATNKIASFIDELLEVSRLGFIRANFKRELIDFEKVIKYEIDGMLELARKKNQSLVFKTAARDPNIWADEKKISRVVMNLLSNALKYTPTVGKIEVMLSEDEPSETLKLAVINTGPGMTEEEINTIFGKYQRLDKHSNIEGTGLGLSIAKAIVDLHNGRITATSEVGKSTEFNVILPKDLRSRAVKETV